MFVFYRPILYKPLYFLIMCIYIFNEQCCCSINTIWWPTVEGAGVKKRKDQQLIEKSSIVLKIKILFS